MKDYLSRAKVERDEKWDDWIEKIPNLSFPPTWQIRIIPPFAGALVRFLVFANGRRISVYLDVNESLGYAEGPYWEVYPVEGENARCAIDDVKGLMQLLILAVEAEQ
jgi:hypothetical protein